MIRKRGKSFEVRVWIVQDGKRRKHTIGSFPTRKEAREAEAKATINRPTHSQWTIRQFAERWFTVYHGPHTRRKALDTLTHHRDALSHFLNEYGDLRLTAFGPDDAANYAAEFQWRAKVASAMFNDAVRDRKIPASPFQGHRFAKGKGRSQIDPLTMGEIEQLANLAERIHGFYGPHFAAFITLAGWTGMRPGELCRLEWGDIKWDDRVILVRTSKTEKPREVPMAPRARRALESVMKVDDRVFLTARGKRMKPYSYRYFWVPVRAAFEEQVPRDHWLAQRLRVDPSDHLDMYESRHAFGSFLARQGMSAWEIAEILGNSARVCEEIYVHPYFAHARNRAFEAFDAYEAELDGARGGRIAAGEAR